MRYIGSRGNKVYDRIRHDSWVKGIAMAFGRFGITLFTLSVQVIEMNLYSLHCLIKNAAYHV